MPITTGQLCREPKLPYRDYSFKNMLQSKLKKTRLAVKMRSFLPVVVAVIAWSASSAGEMVHVISWDGWEFYKVRATGAMTNANVKVTCEAAGMRYPCYGGNETCFGWASDCISVNSYANDCRVPLDFFHLLCGPPYGRWCAPLGDMFVYLPDVLDDGGGCGFTWCTSGAKKYDKFALCAVAVGTCASSPCTNGSTCLDQPNGHTCVCAPGYGGNYCERGRIIYYI
ncbi:delta and Notch-like epidermal growth factor-related receptor [Branchiostoma lanceolatum]|uniref:delta and Notch-like epidermal growth factor-related receptor n=1 Tax=Branchiostoma lanceolatum TaxID=7740 RepID=UPI0034546C9C